jgi:hypothetical protein
MPGWITAFKLIPWASVLAAAPAVVAGARKLWDARRDRGQAPPLNEQIAELRKDLTAASELLARLAEQNQRLVEAVQILRVRTRVLLVVSAALAVAVVGLAIYLAKQ